MVVDTASVRLAFIVVAVTMLLLFYFVSFRRTRSAYCGWWCIALLLFLGGSAAYLLDGTDQQWWANPLGSVLLVSGAASTWAGARTLRTTRPALRLLALGPVAVGLVAAMDSPGTNTWAGGSIYLLMMSTLLILGAVELWRLDHGLFDVSTAMCAAAALAGGFYFYRWIAYLVVGPDDSFFLRYAGAGLVTLINLVLLVTVSYSMTVLGNNEAMSELRTRATRDGLTGLLNRTEFVNRATTELRHVRRSKVDGALILADLDNFKTINDTDGHQVGDNILEQFAAACEATVRSSDLIGRYGGDEFIIFLSGSDVDNAVQITTEISSRLTMSVPCSRIAPSVSYGIAAARPGTVLSEVIAAADVALYQAKTAGRNGHVIAGDDARGTA